MWEEESQHINANLKIIKAILDSFVLTSFAKLVCTRRVRIRARQQNLSLIFFSFCLYSADLLHLSAISIILIIYLSMAAHLTVCSCDPFNQKDINTLSKTINQLWAILCCLMGREPNCKEKHESL